MLFINASLKIYHFHFPPWVMCRMNSMLASTTTCIVHVAVTPLDPSRTGGCTRDDEHVPFVVQFLMSRRISTSLYVRVGPGRLHGKRRILSVITYTTTLHFEQRSALQGRLHSSFVRFYNDTSQSSVASRRSSSLSTTYLSFSAYPTVGKEDHQSSLRPGKAGPNL